MKKKNCFGQHCEAFWVNYGGNELLCVNPTPTSTIHVYLGSVKKKNDGRWDEPNKIQGVVSTKAEAMLTIENLWQIER